MRPKVKASAPLRVAVSIIDEPQVPVRLTHDEQRFAELKDSIAALGVLEPIAIRSRGDRFEVVYGHRRLLAVRALDQPDIPALIVDGDDASLEAMKIAENVEREEWNPAEEAEYYKWLLKDKCGDDVDRLCALLRKKRAYVEQRLLMAAGDREVLHAVHRREISMAVAAELNLVTDDTRRKMWLDSAIRGGATARGVRKWREDGEYFDSLQTDNPQPARPAALPPPQPPGSALVCYICGSNDDAFEFDTVPVHRSCRQVNDRSRRAQSSVAPLEQQEEPTE